MNYRRRMSKNQIYFSDLYNYHTFVCLDTIPHPCGYHDMQEIGQKIHPEALVTPEVERWVFNRKPISLETLLRTLMSAFNPQVLVANGGYLFKASLDGTVFHLGIVPTLHEGERGYHFNIHLKQEDVFTLIGNITPKRELTILFRNPAMKEEDNSIYQRVYAQLARLFLNASPDKPFTLDWITTHLMEEKRIFPQLPQTLEELAEALPIQVRMCCSTLPK